MSSIAIHRVETSEELGALHEAIYAETKEALEPYLRPYLEGGLASTALHGAMLTFEARPDDEAKQADIRFRLLGPPQDGFHFDLKRVPAAKLDNEPAPVILDIAPSKLGAMGIFAVLPQNIRIAQDVILTSPEYNAELFGGIELTPLDIAGAVEGLARVQAGVQRLGETTTRFTGLRLAST